MYRGFTVIQEVINDYPQPCTDLVVQADCGCQACENKVQPGHPICNSSPKELVEDPNVSAIFDNGRWYWSYHGPLENVDKWLGEKGESDR